MRLQDAFASTQILAFNPILKENIEVRIQYFLYLKELIRLAKWNKRKYTKAQIVFYRKTLLGDGDIPCASKENKIPYHMSYLMPYDLALMLAFQKKAICTEKVATIVSKIVTDFGLPNDAMDFLYREFDAALGSKEAWHKVFRNKAINGYKRYLKVVKENVFFLEKFPYSILITATMSAGKSTLINTLVGKNVCRMQNMACTSKIHTIISKPFEDGTTSEYDHDFLIDATKEDLFTNNEKNLSSKISVGTYFNGALGGQRIIMYDSPGVNSSVNDEHREITYKMLHSRKYELVMYVMNATQLGTNDEDYHLNVVREEIKRTKVIFIINKIDHLLSDDDNIYDVIEHQRRFLISKGFRHPIICPVSARAAYLVKKSEQEELSRTERREKDVFIDKFNQHSLATYYEKYLHCPFLSGSKDESKNLLKDCGFSYLEQIIKHLSNGGRINGTGSC